jgi:hypothetical protein
MIYFRTFEQATDYIENVYHCSDRKFDIFSDDYMTNNNGDQYGKGFYFTNNLEYAKQFGEIIYRCDITLHNPIDLTKNTASILTNISHDIEDAAIESLILSGSYTTAYRLIRKYKSEDDFKAMGYDGVIGWCEMGGKEYLIFNGHQVLSISNK